jgi:hypothetical protein
MSVLNGSVGVGIIAVIFSGSSMIDFIKKHMIITAIITLIFTGLLIMFLVNSYSKYKGDNRDRDDYIKVFLENKDTLNNVVNMLVPLDIECYIKIVKNYGWIHAEQDVYGVELSKYDIDSNIKDALLSAMNKFNLIVISRTDDFIEFCFDFGGITKQGYYQYRIVYAVSNKSPNYSNIELLEENWYLTYLMFE